MRECHARTLARLYFFTLNEKEFISYLVKIKNRKIKEQDKVKEMK